MPLLKVETNVPIAGEKLEELQAALSTLVSRAIGKPEQYVMVAVNPAAIWMSGKAGDAAFVDVRSIGGLGRNVNSRLTSEVCSLLMASLGISPSRVYVNFSEFEAANWGWNAETFG